MSRELRSDTKLRRRVSLAMACAQEHAHANWGATVGCTLELEDRIKRAEAYLADRDAREMTRLRAERAAEVEVLRLQSFLRPTRVDPTRRTVHISELTGPQRRLVLALLDAKRHAEEAAA